MTRRISLFLVMSVVLVLASYGAAFAVQGDSTYLARTTLSGASPHRGYALTTQKCAVCHAVHNAVVGGEALLRSPRADACTYCHITTTVSNLKVYGGVEANYNGADNPNSHNNAGVVAVQCTSCHQVHGAIDLMTANVALSQELLLKGLVVTSPPEDEYSDYDRDSDWANFGAPLSGEPKALAMSKWCTKCHKYWPGSVSGVNVDSHVLTGPDSTHAFVGSNYCTSCHNSTTYQGSTPLAAAFPHYTDGKRFLTQAATSAGSETGAGPATDGTNDGVCLRCHRNGGSSGVGLTF